MFEETKQKIMKGSRKRFD